MPAVGIKQPTFAGGEITPALGGRADTTKHATGVYRMRDWLINRSGIAFNRPGTKYLATAKGNYSQTRMATFSFNDDQSFTLEVGEEYIRFFQDEAAILTGAQSDWADSTAYEPGDIVVDGAAGGNSGDFFYCVATHTSDITTAQSGPHQANGLAHFWSPLTASGSSAILEVPTPYDRADLQDLVFTQSADVLTITHRNYPPHELLRLASDKWTCLPIRFAPRIAGPKNITGSGGTGTSDTIRFKVTALRKDTLEESMPGSGTAEGTDLTVDDPVSGSDLNVNAPSHAVKTGDEVYLTVVETQSVTKANENARIALLDTVFVATDVGTNDFSLNETDGLLTTPAISASFPSIQVDVRFAFLKMTKNAPTTDDSTWIDLTWDAVPDAIEYWVYRSVNGGPYGYIGSTRDHDASTGKPIFTDEGLEADLESGPPLYKNPFREDDWPAVSGYYQQRQWFGGTTNSPQKMWGSRVGDYRNFSTRSPLLDDDAVEFTIQEAQVNEIVGLAVLGKLLIFTRGGVLSPSGDGDGVIKPSAINIETLSTRGCDRIPPLLVGDAVLYVERGGQIVRELRYSLASGGFAGYTERDMTVFAPHFFAGRTVREWAYAQAPYSIVWVVLDNGGLLSMTYLPEHDIWGWAKHSISGTVTRVRGITAVPVGSEDVPYMLVRRTVNGSGVRYVEKLMPFVAGDEDYDTRADPWFVDSGLIYNGTGATTTTVTATGASYAAGATVTLAASAAAFASTDDGYRLKGSDGSEVEMALAVFTNSQSVTATLLQACPASLQATGTTSWVVMTNAVSGLDHLEGETVTVVADGRELTLTSAVVASGALSLAAANGGRAAGYGIVIVGLGYTPSLVLLGFDVVGLPDSALDKQKNAISASIGVKDARGLQAGVYGLTAKDVIVPAAYGYSAAPALPTVPALLEATVKAEYPTDWDDSAKLEITQPYPYPAKVLWAVRNIFVGGKT